MNIVFLAILVLYVAHVSIQVDGNSSSTSITITSLTPSVSVLREYASVNLDWWHNTTMSGGHVWGNASILTIDLNNTKLKI